MGISKVRFEPDNLMIISQKECHLLHVLAKKWVIEEVLYPWILDSVIPQLGSLSMRQLKKNDQATQRYHSEKNDQDKIAQQINIEIAQYQGDQSFLSYTNELSEIYSELDHNRPPSMTLQIENLC